jgi:hypothetical protein
VGGDSVISEAWIGTRSDLVFVVAESDSEALVITAADS